MYSRTYIRSFFPPLSLFHTHLFCLSVPPCICPASSDSRLRLNSYVYIYILVLCPEDPNRISRHRLSPARKQRHVYIWVCAFFYILYAFSFRTRLCIDKLAVCDIEAEGSSDIYMYVCLYYVKSVRICVYCIYDKQHAWFE